MILEYHNTHTYDNTPGISCLYTCTYGHTHVHTDMLHYMQIQGEDLAADKLG